jgi:hypothetical protein
MNKEFIPYEQALALKELGFNEPCFATYSNVQEAGIEKGSLSYYKGLFLPVSSKMFCLAPTFSQAFRWFREKYKLHSHISLGISDEQDRSGLEYDEYIYVIEGLNGLDYDNYGESLFYKTPEEAELACLKKLIEIVKNNNK